MSPNFEDQRPGRREFVLRAAIVIALLALVALGLTIFGLAWTAMLTLFGGVLIGVLLDGMAQRVAGWTKMPRWLALLLVGLLTLGVLVGTGFLLGPALTEHAQGLREQLTNSWTSLREWLEARSWGQQILEEVSQLELSDVLSPRFGGMLSTTIGVITSLVLMLVFGAYFAIAPQLYVGGFAWLLPPRHRHRVHELAGAIARALRSWLLGRFMSMVVVGAGTALGLWIAGVPAAGTLGLIAGLLSFVPNVGPIMASIPGILIGLAVDLQTAAWAVVVYVGVQALDNYAITPVIQQRVVSMPPVLVLGFQMLLGLSAGVLGLFMATPLLVTIVVLIQALYVRGVLGDDIRLIGEHEGEH